MKTVSIVTLRLERVTKGAILYKNVSTAPKEAMTTLYLRKEGLPTPFPGSITVTIEVPEE